MRRTLPHRGRLSQAALAVAALAAAAAAGAAAPGTALLPAPAGTLELVLTTLLLGTAFAMGMRWPLQALYGVLALTLLEGAIRKWALNTLTVFLLKDFVLVGVYAAVLPRLDRDAWRRPWWLVAPAAGLVVLAVVTAPASTSVAQALVGLRSYALYVPLLWAAPALLSTPRRVRLLLFAILAAAVAESVFALVQAYAGPGVLNRLVAGAVPAVVIVGDVTYLRPAGTFMQVGVLAAFVFVAVLVACSAVALGDRALRLAGAATIAIATWAVVYTSSRALLATVAVAVMLVAGWLLAQRRVARAALVPGAVAVGLVLVLAALPAARDVVTADEGPEKRKILSIHANGEVVEIEAAIGDGGSAGGDFLGRATDFGDGGAGSRFALWSGRVRPQLEIVADQRLVGHGPGTMTLGSEYVHPEERLRGESQLAKAAWELGLPGLLLYVWLLVAAAAVALRALARTRDERRVLAGAAVLLTVLLPLWLVLTFAYDYPIVGELYWLLVGCCAGWTTARPEAEA